MITKSLNFCDLSKLWKDENKTEQATRIALEQQDFICDFVDKDFLNIKLSMITGIQCLKSIGSIEISSNNQSEFEILMNTGINKINQIQCEKLSIRTQVVDPYFECDSILCDNCTMSGTVLNAKIGSISVVSGIELFNISGNLSEVICETSSYISGVDQEKNIKYLQAGGQIISSPTTILECDLRESNFLFQNIPDLNGLKIFHNSPQVIDTNLSKCFFRYEEGSITFINSLDSSRGYFSDQTEVIASVIGVRHDIDFNNVPEGEDPQSYYGGYGDTLNLRTVNSGSVYISNYKSPAGKVTTSFLQINNFEYLGQNLEVQVDDTIDLTIRKMNNDHDNLAYGSEFVERSSIEGVISYENPFYTGVEINKSLYCNVVNIRGKNDIIYELDSSPDQPIIGHYNYALLKKDIFVKECYMDKIANYGTLTVSDRCEIINGTNFGTIKLSNSGKHYLANTFINLGTIEFY